MNLPSDVSAKTGLPTGESEGQADPRPKTIEAARDGARVLEAALVKGVRAPDAPPRAAAEPTEMEWRVAEAMFRDAHPAILMPFRHYVGRELWIQSARAAIRAMRLPITEDMAHAAVQLNICDDMDAAEIWGAMLEAASPAPQVGNPAEASLRR